MQVTPVWFLGWEDPLEKGMATHSSILTWRIPWTEKPGRLQSRGPQRIGHEWVTEHACMHKERALTEVFPSSSMPSLDLAWAISIMHLMVGPRSPVKTTSRGNSALATVIPYCFPDSGIHYSFNHDKEKDLSATVGEGALLSLKHSVRVLRMVDFLIWVLAMWINPVCENSESVHSWNMHFSVCILPIFDKIRLLSLILIYVA